MPNIIMCAVESILFIVSWIVKSQRQSTRIPLVLAVDTIRCKELKRTAPSLARQTLQQQKTQHTSKCLKCFPLLDNYSNKVQFEVVALQVKQRSGDKLFS